MAFAATSAHSIALRLGMPGTVECLCDRCVSDRCSPIGVGVSLLLCFLGSLEGPVRSAMARRQRWSPGVPAYLGSSLSPKGALLTLFMCLAPTVCECTYEPGSSVNSDLANRCPSSTKQCSDPRCPTGSAAPYVHSKFYDPPCHTERRNAKHRTAYLLHCRCRFLLDATHTHPLR